MEFKVRLRKWGNSVGIVIPKRLARKAHIKMNQEIVVDIKKANVLREAFGSLKDWKIDSQTMKDELRKEWQ